MRPGSVLRCLAVLTSSSTPLGLRNGNFPTSRQIGQRPPPPLRNTFLAHDVPPGAWVALHNLRPGALSGCPARPFLRNPDPATPARAAVRTRSTVTAVPCSTSRERRTSNRAPPPRGGVARSGLCPHARAAQTDRLLRADTERRPRRARDGRTSSTATVPPSVDGTWDRALVTAEVAREICNPASPQQFPPSLDAG